MVKPNRAKADVWAGLVSSSTILCGCQRCHEGIRPGSEQADHVVALCTLQPNISACSGGLIGRGDQIARAWLVGRGVRYRGPELLASDSLFSDAKRMFHALMAFIGVEARSSRLKGP